MSGGFQISVELGVGWEGLGSNDWRGRRGWWLMGKNVSDELFFHWPLNDFKVYDHNKVCHDLHLPLPDKHHPTICFFSVPCASVHARGISILSGKQHNRRSKLHPLLLGWQEVTISRHRAKWWQIASRNNGVSFSINIFLQLIKDSFPE